MVDTGGKVPDNYNTCVDHLPCEGSDIQPLDGQYKKGH